MKIGIFTDPHFSSADRTCGKRCNSKALERIDNALQYFLDEKCDMIICLGDLIDRDATHAKEIENLNKVSDAFSSCAVPIYAVMGN